MDMVLITSKMCTNPDVKKALLGIRKVLKPNSRLLFAENRQLSDLSVQGGKKD